MYPFIRMTKELVTHRNAPRLGLTGTHVSHHICWPWDIDLWMDPFWREGLFMSKRLVDALEAANLLEGTHDGWRMVSCREPLEQEVEQDQLQPWMRAITDEEWSAMDSQTFRDLGARARKEHKENPPPPPDPFEGMTEEAIDRAKKRQQKLFKKLGIKT